MIKALKEAGWVFLFSIVAVLVATAVIGLVQNSTSSEFGNIYVNSWPIMVASILIVTILRFLIVILPARILTIVFLCIGFFFLIASDTGNPVAISIRDFFDSTFNIDNRALIIAGFAIVIALIFPLPQRDEG